jgi:hypothetical protein
VTWLCNRIIGEKGSQTINGNLSEMTLDESLQLLVEISRSSKNKTCLYYLSYLYDEDPKLEESIIHKIFLNNKEKYLLFKSNQLDFLRQSRMRLQVNKYLRSENIPTMFKKTSSD